MVSRRTVVLLAGWLVVIFLLMMPTAALAQDQPTGIVWNEVGAWSIRVDVPAGIGLEQHTVGYTTDGDEITLSAGGGAGLLLAGEYDVSDHLRFEAGVGIVQSALSMVLENGRERSPVLSSKDHCSGGCR